MRILFASLTLGMIFFLISMVIAYIIGFIGRVIPDEVKRIISKLLK